VSACADLVVEGAVDLVLLGTEDRCEVVCHCEPVWRMLCAEYERERSRSVSEGRNTERTPNARLYRMPEVSGELEWRR
jgi:hypothetical protein